MVCIHIHSGIVILNVYIFVFGYSAGICLLLNLFLNTASHIAAFKISIKMGSHMHLFCRKINAIGLLLFPCS